MRDAGWEPVWSLLAQAATAIDRLDAEVLLAHQLGCHRLEMLQDPSRRVDPGKYTILLARRLRGEPVAYITGNKEFWSLELAVTRDVLIPRPDSETLVEAATRHFAGTAGPRSVLDLGTGSGALLLAALTEWPAAAGVGVDASRAALAVAAANAVRLGFGDRTRFVEGGWDGDGAAHDLILCNPPYVAAGEPLPNDVLDWEPHAALFAGPDGLDDYRRIAPVLAPQLASGGVACVEIGATQAAAAGALFAAHGFAAQLRRDLAGQPRCLSLTHRN